MPSTSTSTARRPASRRSLRSLITALALIGALHGFIGISLLPALPLNLAGTMLCVAILCASTLLIPLSILSGSVFSSQRTADRISWVGSLLMGFFSSLLVLTLARDLLMLVLPSGWACVSAQLAVGLALLVTLAGFVNARRVAGVVDVEVPIAGLAAALHGFTIVQLSDIHVGPTIKHGYVSAIVERVNGLRADMVAITGDVVDGSVRQLARHTAPLGQLTSRHGTYIVTGNHEYYSGAREWMTEFARIGLRGLNNEHVVLRHDGAPLVLAGVTDFGAHHFDLPNRSDPQRAMAGAPPGAPSVLLAHQPRSAPAAADAGFDLQLSGHTHGGQFWPWNLFVRFQQPYTAGLHRLRGLWVYTSRGTGYWGPPKRFGAPAEITRLRLVPA